MSVQRDFRLAIMLGIGVALLTCVPYIIASGLPGNSLLFNGFLMNPVDGFSYLAKMRQGYAGTWLFELPYASDPGPASFVYIYYLFLGHIAAWTNLPLIIIYHGARVLAAILMLIMAFLLYRRLLPDRRHVWTAYWLTLLGSGVGWIAVPFGIVASDLWIPESIPFLSGYVNPHFPLAAAAFLGAMLAMASDDIAPSRRALLAVFCGFTLGAVLPFALAALLPTLVVWQIWERIASWRRAPWGAPQLAQTGYAFGSLLVGASPWLLYDFWLTREQPSIGGWVSQNITPSPPPGEYLLGYGLILVLAVLGLARARLLSTQGGRLLASWAAITAIVLYTPFGLQRRASLGLFFSLAALGSYGVHSLAREKLKTSHILILVLALSVPSHLVVMMAGLSGVANEEALLVTAQADMKAFQWLRDNAAPGSLVLAAPTNGNKLPAYAPVRVLYGHPMETPQADQQRDLVEALYAWSGSDQGALDLLHRQGVRYVLVGAEERKIGAPEWIKQLERVYSAQGSEIFRMMPK